MQDSGPGAAVAISLSKITKSFLTGRAFVSIIGPSGCGKSTILNIAAGLLQPTAGSVRIFGEHLASLNRHASYMFQQDTLLPWKTILENVRMGLEFRGQGRREADRVGLLWIDRVGLRGFAGHYPHQLSGGMRRRAALAQSWIVDPAIILMDEPFGGLDVQTRQRMWEQLVQLWSGTDKTAMLVTHDLEEAITLSDEVVVLSAGPRSRIAARYRVDLPRPRNIADIKVEARFMEVYRTIWNVLRAEVLKSDA
jgi:NitT/TauT family transport system ATP-binding protein